MMSFRSSLFSVSPPCRHQNRNQRTPPESKSKINPLQSAAYDIWTMRHRQEKAIIVLIT